MQPDIMQNRTHYFDNIRVFATLLIIFLHTASYQWYLTDINSASWFILNLWKVFTNHAVLLFIMISGALFLSRDIPVKKLYTKYALRILIAYVFWSVIYGIYASLGALTLRNVVIHILSSHYHLWFLPMIIGLYIIVPLLKLIIQSEKGIRYFLGLSLVFTFVIPYIFTLFDRFTTGPVQEVAALINGRINDMNVRLVVGYAFYFVCGYLISKINLSKRMRLAIYGLGIIGFVITAVTSTFECRRAGIAIDTFHGNFNLPVLFAVAATFVLFKYCAGGRKSACTTDSTAAGSGQSTLAGDKAASADAGAAGDKTTCEDQPQSCPLRRTIMFMSKCSFGAYLIHDLILQLLDRFTPLNGMFINPVPGVIITGIVTFIIAFAVSAVLNLIPVVKKYIV